MSRRPHQDGADGKPKVYPRINFRTDHELRDKIDRDASALGLTVGSYMRLLADRHARTRAVRRPLADEILLAQLKAEAGRVGGNIAQLLRLANRGEIFRVDELEDAANAVRNFYVKALELLKGNR